MLIREQIEASFSTSAAPAGSDSSVESSAKDKDDGGDVTVDNPKVAINTYFRNTKGTSDVKRDEEAKKLADNLKSNNISDEDSILNAIKTSDNADDEHRALAQKITTFQNT